MVNGIVFYFVKNFQCITQRFGHVCKEFIHLFARLHPLLLGIKHTTWVVQVLAGTQTNQPVVRFGIFFIHEMDVVRTNQLDVELLRILHQVFVHIHLQWVTFVIGTGNSRFMTLHLKIEIVTKQVLIPLYGFFGFRKLSGSNPFRYFTTKTSRTDNQSFMILLKFATVCTRTHIVPPRPCVRY